jgi:hypothetical protein
MTITARIASWVWRARMPLTLLAVLGSVSAAAYASLAARTAARPTFTLRATPTSAQITAGASASYRITVHRSHLASIISLRITAGLPRGAHAQLAPGRTRGSHATLTITTSKRTRPGNYRLRIAAFSATLRRTVGLTLRVRSAASTPATPTAPATPATPTAQGLPFTVSGDLSNLVPGQAQRLDVSLANPNSATLAVSNLTVAVKSVSAPHATAALPCTPADFAVSQFSGAYPLAAPPSATRTLADLGIPSAQWPQVSIIDRPSNQDGCKGATVTLAYSGTATGG